MSSSRAGAVPNLPGLLCPPLRNLLVVFTNFAQFVSKLGGYRRLQGGGEVNKTLRDGKKLDLVSGPFRIYLNRKPYLQRIRYTEMTLQKL